MEIDFSFCIITDNSIAACKRISQIIESIRMQNIPNYEIIVIGGEDNKFRGNMHDVKKIHFNESIKPRWLTKKKNDIVKLCKYENVVMMHDYFILHHSWYFHYKEFLSENEYDVCCNPILMINGVREYTDWVSWDYPGIPKHSSLPYHDWTKTSGQYISGGYFLVKKKFLMENPFNENLIGGQQEDVEWSKRIRNKAKIICNPKSYCKHNKTHRNQHVDLWRKLL
tara:strand:- start:3306 stop:3980 length:675 start_codon:yes stop_codon:yes gene_type:complete